MSPILPRMSASRRTGHPPVRRPLLLSNNRRPSATFPPAASTSGLVDNQPASSRLYNPQELALLRAGYASADVSQTKNDADSDTASTSTPARSRKKRCPKTPNHKMAEPRARAARHKGQMNFASERMFSLVPRQSYRFSTASTWSKREGKDACIAVTNEKT